ncbi:MAG: hypothetical protein GF308_19285 [Candidatus Heimdallarchaeota archaeon]|nr:hypothetical protein [Candidatus Heimdallarchaeota archaeon]
MILVGCLCLQLMVTAITHTSKKNFNVKVKTAALSRFQNASVVKGSLFPFPPSSQRFFVKANNTGSSADLSFWEIIGIVDGSIGVTGAIIGFISFLIRKIRRRDLYSVIWKKSSTLSPKEILEKRGEKEYGFRSFYYPRKEDSTLKESFENYSKGHIIILGSKIAGKTRMIYHWLKEGLAEPIDVLIPKKLGEYPLRPLIPKRLNPFARKRAKIVLLDELEYYNGTNFPLLLTEILKKNITIVATCRLEENNEKNISNPC